MVGVVTAAVGGAWHSLAINVPCSVFSVLPNDQWTGNRCAVQVLILLNAGLQFWWYTTTAVCLAFALRPRTERVLCVGDEERRIFFSPKPRGYVHELVYGASFSSVRRSTARTAQYVAPVLFTGASAKGNAFHVVSICASLARSGSPACLSSLIGRWRLVVQQRRVEY